MKQHTAEELSKLYESIEQHDAPVNTLWYNGYMYVRKGKKVEKTKMLKRKFCKEVLGMVNVKGV